jgi:ribosomal protein S18 acetylase RimI-like enzyme
MTILSGDEYSLLIRKAKLEDLERIVDFNIQMAKETEEKILEKNVAREGVKAVLNNELKGFFLLAEENKGEKKICGQLMITFEWSDWRNKNIWWIQSVFVDKNYRNRKVFSKLFKSVTKMALSEKGVGGLRLYVEKHNDSAKQVYESLGMKKTSYEIYEKWL